jgi:hypothetical protein
MSIQQQFRSGFMPSESLLLDAANLIDELQAKLETAEKDLLAHVLLEIKYKELSEKQEATMTRIYCDRCGKKWK